MHAALGTADIRMGCPPDPVEVSIWRSGERIGELQEKYNRLVAEFAEAVALAKQLITRFSEKNMPSREIFERRTGVVPTEAEPYADDGAQYKLEQGYATKVKDLENRLCELRTRLVKIADPGTDAAQMKTLHRAHRLEDREQWLAWLQEKIRLLEYLLGRDDTMDLDRPACEQMIRDIRVEIHRISGLSDEELMHNRGILRADQELWRTPYLPFD